MVNLSGPCGKIQTAPGTNQGERTTNNFGQILNKYKFINLKTLKSSSDIVDEFLDKLNGENLYTTQDEI